jgi:hypothetical protein
MPQINRRSAVQPSTPRVIRKMPSIDGTKCAVVTPARTISSISPAGSLCSSGAGANSVAPCCNVQKNSHTETSKLKVVFCKTTSVLSSP